MNAIAVHRQARRTPATLPLGIDIGSTRVRAALLESTPGGPRLVAVAARERTGPIAERLRELLGDLGTRERRCVFGVAEPEGLVRSVTFPQMPARERAQAARFEADRFTSSAEPVVIRLFPLEAKTRFTLAIARRSAIDARLRLAGEIGLTCVAIDNAAFAYERLTRANEALLDIGADAAMLYLYSDPVPSSHRFEGGGDRLTRAVAESLSIDRETAERRKRTHGLGGAATNAVNALVESISATLVGARSRGLRVDMLTLAGNGTRLSEIAVGLASSTGLQVGTLETLPIPCATLPQDVVRAELPDWGLAIGLALRPAS